MTTIDPEDLLVLLEDGPHSGRDLVLWLHRPQAGVSAVLRRMARSGLVKRVGPQQLWALASYVEPAAAQPQPVSAQQPPAAPRRPHDDSVFDDDPDAPEDPDAALLDELLPPPASRGRATRVVVPAVATVKKDAPPAWWVGKSREELNTLAAAKASVMSASPEGRKLTPWRFAFD